jgi:hypothetical protein
MDNFDFKKYLAEGKIHQDLTENLGIELPKVTSQKANAKITNARTFAEFILDTWNTIATEENESIFGIQDLKLAKEKLVRVAKMKDEGEPVAENARTDAEKRGKNKINKENLPVNENEDFVVTTRMLQMALRKDPKFEEKVYKAVEDAKNGKTNDLRDIINYLSSLKIDEEVSSEEVSDEEIENIEDTLKKITENARTRAEEEGFLDGKEEGFLDGKAVEKADMKKMKVSELKAKIKEQILAELSLSEADEEDDREDDELSPEELANKYAGSPMREADEEVDVDIDVEDEVDVDVEADDIEIEKPATKVKVKVGLSPEEELIQDSLKAAMDAADAIGNDKLSDQIGNTITFFTREYVVGDRS